MPDWLMTLSGWTSLVLGGLGLWRGVTSSLRAGTTRQEAPGQLVIMESGGLVLFGTAILLGGGWVHLVWPGLILATMSEVRRIRIWLRRRRNKAGNDAGPGRENHL